MSRSSIGISARRSTTLASSAGVGMVKRAPFICVACAVSASAMLRRNGKTCSETISNIVAGSLVLQPRPAHVLIGDAAALPDLVLARREDAPLDRLAEAVGLVLLAGMRLIQPAHEQEVGDLLDHLERIGDAARPERVPHAVDLGAKFTVSMQTSIDTSRKLHSKCREESEGLRALGVFVHSQAEPAELLITRICGVPFQERRGCPGQARA